MHVIEHARGRLATDAPTLDALEAVAVVAAVADVWLTRAVAVEGPAVEVGMGATYVLDTAGVGGFAVLILAGTLWAFQSVRYLHAHVGREWGHVAAGYVLGILMFNVITNVALALRVGAL